MSYKKSFSKVLKRRFSAAPIILEEVEKRYELISKEMTFYKTSSNPLDKRLDFSAYFLALIQTLDARRMAYEEIRNIALEITHDYVRPKNALQRWLKKLPPKLIGTPLAAYIIQSLHKKTSKKGHPDGFQANIITDKDKTFGLGYGIDIIECGICKLFQKYDATRYAAILCEVDKMTSDLAGLELIRTGTIANGAAKCDFRFKKQVKN